MTGHTESHGGNHRERGHQLRFLERLHLWHVVPYFFCPLPVNDTIQDVAMDRPIADAFTASYAEFAVDGESVEGIMTPILNPVQVREKTRFPATTVAYKSPSGSLFPQKLVLHLLTLCIEKHGLNLQTHAPVQRVVSGAGGAGSGWLVETDRRVVETKVVDATNAFTATLLLGFLDHIYFFKGRHVQTGESAPGPSPSQQVDADHRHKLQAYSDYHRRDLQYRDDKFHAPALITSGSTLGYYVGTS
ncbi:Fad dependent oxidoreductase [Mycena sanguinolenta]|uniref:Fad dependent oxidoreductase n=1 Tax=Mycena sanguinolenta TaxID=230812 RepID=A0A8H7DKK1_9AGAR|nr:Fad dependent oxidoreductase [Mycena sanguinolenta]